MHLRVSEILKFSYEQLHSTSQFQKGVHFEGTTASTTDIITVKTGSLTRDEQRPLSPHSLPSFFPSFLPFLFFISFFLFKEGIIFFLGNNLFHTLYSDHGFPSISFLIPHAPIQLQAFFFSLEKQKDQEKRKSTEIPPHHTHIDTKTSL